MSRPKGKKDSKPRVRTLRRRHRHTTPDKIPDGIGLPPDPDEYRDGESGYFSGRHRWGTPNSRHITVPDGIWRIVERFARIQGCTTNAVIVGLVEQAFAQLKTTEHNIRNVAGAWDALLKSRKELHDPRIGEKEAEKIRKLAAIQEAKEKAKRETAEKKRKWHQRRKQCAEWRENPVIQVPPEVASFFPDGMSYETPKAPCPIPPGSQAEGEPPPQSPKIPKSEGG